MSFFKKLKERLFSSKDKEEESNEIVITKEVVAAEVKQEASKTKVEKLEEKIQKKKEKEIIKKGKLDKYVVGLGKTGSSFSNAIKEIQSRHNKIDEEFFEELEEALIMADISFTLVEEIIMAIKIEVKKENIVDTSLISEIIADKMFLAYAGGSVVDTELNIQKGRKNVIIVVGVNGVGKTTSIAKLAYSLIKQDYKVLVAAGDTFRAGAVAQLEEWVNRVGATIVKSDKEGADPASVVFDSVTKFKNEDFDVLIVDTAGRLQNKVNLMNELKKMSAIIQREVPDAPHESLIVIDSTTGQNGVSQAKNFKDVTPLTGIILTKMDGTSKGGIILTIKEQLGLAVKLVGLGEGLDDLQEFDLDSFIYAMTKDLMKEE